MSERENPLRRWARLKQATIAAKEIDGSGPTQTPEAAPFEAASLPSIESIAADTDIIAFLRAGVPAELTRAALRRAWTSDPAVRDFIGIAENQWDFNDPNAIPGFGLLVPTESSVDILQISSRVERQPPTPEHLAAAEPTIPSSTNANASDGQLDVNKPPPIEMAAPEEAENTPMAGEARKPRRHGSALPH